jgi:hypothetical protein
MNDPGSARLLDFFHRHLRLGLAFAVLLQRIRYSLQARWCTSLIP